jgi:hypothetical protein
MTSVCARCAVLVAASLLVGLGLGGLPSGPTITSRNVSVMVEVTVTDPGVLAAVAPSAELVVPAADDGGSAGTARRGGSRV